MTLTEVVARLDERIKAMGVSNDAGFKTITGLLEKQNDKVQKNAEKISENKNSITRIVGIGIGIAFILGIAIGLVKFL